MIEQRKERPVEERTRPQSKPDLRIQTIEDRINPVTGKKTRSFRNKSGAIKFLERPCDICALAKKQEWHFSFECPLKQAAAYVISFDDSDSENSGDGGVDLPGVSSTPFTDHPTSHVFQMIANLNSEESGKGSRDL
ncbi:hypothetical protein BDZ91DRAFT_734338 [Kalaharituber pfeilii]|nr:hypothetical protein BDZ91DRAFT_741264 [Kalaharituber pfeilii]KAF8462364.1 hypothetical protein BDZ91DRAFT_734338 [Kalaharituber pfeilii]